MAFRAVRTVINALGLVVSQRGEATQNYTSEGARAVDYDSISRILRRAERHPWREGLHGTLLGPGTILFIYFYSFFDNRQKRAVVIFD